MLSENGQRKFSATRVRNCQLKEGPTDRSVSGVVGTRIDRELALVGVGSKRACDQDGESQEWGLACRWHGDVTQLSTPRKVGCTELVDRQIANDLFLGR